MAQIIVCDFGEKDGVRTYRVNGEKADLERIVKETLENGGEFKESPEIELIRMHQYTVMLKIKIPVKVSDT